MPGILVGAAQRQANIQVSGTFVAFVRCSIITHSVPCQYSRVSVLVPFFSRDVTSIDRLDATSISIHYLRVQFWFRYSDRMLSRICFVATIWILLFLGQINRSRSKSSSGLFFTEYFVLFRARLDSQIDCPEKKASGLALDPDRIRILV